MPIVGRYFPSQRSREKVFLVLRRHWFTYAGFIIISAIMLIPLIIYMFYFSLNSDLYSEVFSNLFILIASAYTLAVLGLNMYGFVDYYLDIYIVTNERIVNIVQSGFFKRDVSELNLHQVQDVNASVKGIFATLFHYGDIYIQTAGEKENFIFKSIPHPYRVSRKIIDLLEEALNTQRIQNDEEAIRAEAEIMKNEEQLTSPNQDISGKEAKVVEEVTGINPSTFKVARLRTKEYLAGSDLEPSVESSVAPDSEITEQDSEKIISMIDRDEVKYSLKKDNGADVLQKLDQYKEKVGNTRKSDTKQAESPAPIAKDNASETADKPEDLLDSEHELEENKEVDL